MNKKLANIIWRLESRRIFTTLQRTPFLNQHFFEKFKKYVYAKF